MPEFQTFFTPDRLDQFWQFIKWFLFFVAPMIMIVVALNAVQQLIVIIKKTMGIKNKQDDDDDYDIYRY